MAEFCIAIEETIVQNFLVDAETTQEAVRKLIESYKKCETVVDQGELCKSQIRCLYGPKQTEDEETNWEEI